MYVKYCRVTPAITYLYFVLSKKKKLQKKKSLSAVFFLKVMDKCVPTATPSLKERLWRGQGMRQRSWDRQEMAVLIKVPSFIFLLHSDRATENPEPSFDEKYPVMSMKKNCTNVHIIFFPSASFLWCHLDIN